VGGGSGLGGDVTFTDLNGEFSVALVQSSDPGDLESCDLEVFHPDYVERTITIDTPDASPSYLTIELERGAKVRGRVMSSRGGVADVLLRLVGVADATTELGRPLHFARSARSRDDGSFEFAPVPCQPSGELWIDDRGAVLQRGVIPLERDLHDLVFYPPSDVIERAREFAAQSPAERMRRERTYRSLAARGERVELVLQLFDHERLEPLRSSLVTVASELEDLRALTDAYGRVHLTLPFGTQILRVACPDFEPLLLDVTTRWNPAPSLWLERSRSSR
jgi:hypothetical protein